MSGDPLRLYQLSDYILNDESFGKHNIQRNCSLSLSFVLMHFWEHSQRFGVWKSSNPWWGTNRQRERRFSWRGGSGGVAGDVRGLQSKQVLRTIAKSVPRSRLSNQPASQLNNQLHLSSYFISILGKKLFCIIFH